MDKFLPLMGETSNEKMHLYSTWKHWTYIGYKI
uniref:Uncharacterized protein n=1 Tax=Arundo donax TaxID=35708 RepID=A0A0A9EQQ2_ARUDO